MKKKHLLLLVTLLFTSTLFAQEETVKNTIIRNGIGFGNALAIVISYTKNKSILWAIIQGIFGWLYVIYFFFTREKEPY
ncbi:MAG: ABC-type Fe3+-siderophore transport system permease subunit [Flavobacterium sp.]|jgi:ABC-type Fe3+-siderophore transport system permease subunit